MPPDSPTPRSRIASLDQFRGYTVAGMLLVNFIGGFQAVGDLWKHHNTYCSYADTIMPQFFFAVGFAFRLTILRRLKTLGAWPATRAVIVRNLGLIALGFVIYHLDGEVKSWESLRTLGFRGFLAQAFNRELFQTLVHIALASLWVTPVIAAGTAARVGFMVASAALHLGLSYWFYFAHAWKLPVIDGGPLGFLTWSIPLLVGSLAYDAMAEAPRRSRVVLKFLAWSVVLMALGYALSGLGLEGKVAPPPFVKPPASQPANLWMMSQRAGTNSYLIFASGVSLAVYALFVVLSDGLGLTLGLFRTFGQNALAAYILHPMVGSAVKPYVPDDSPLWFAMAGFGVYFAICYLFIRYLEKHELFLRL
jgi:predicted acyltransferase